MTDRLGDLLRREERKHVDPVTFTRALVLVLHGKALCLAWSADEGFDEWIMDGGATHGEPFALERAGIAYTYLGEGLHVGRFYAKNDGPCEWSGGDEYSIAFEPERMATAEEWTRHLDEEWPWDFETTPGLFAFDFFDRDTKRMVRRPGVSICHRDAVDVDPMTRAWIVDQNAVGMGAFR